MRLSSTVGGLDYDRIYDAWLTKQEQRLGAAMLRATKAGAAGLEDRLRQDMRGAGLGGLGQAFKATSDAQRGLGVHRITGGFSASGLVYVRSGSARTRGAIEAYTAGADIRPRKGRWLWFPSDEVQRFVGSRKARQRLTPATWASSGMEAKLGPLAPIKSVNGYPLLIVKNVGTSLAGARRSAKSLNKNGRAKKGQRVREILIAFIAIPWTSRQARVDVRAIHRSIMAGLPAVLAQELRRN